MMLFCSIILLACLITERCWFLAFLLVYPWVVRDLFSGAVAQHILPASFTAWQVVKINLFLLALRLESAIGTGITKGAQELKLLK